MSDFWPAVMLFGISAFIFYLAYVGMVTGTAFKTKPYPRSVPRRSGFQYDGVYTQDKDSGKFWWDEILFTASGLAFAIGGVQFIRGKLKERKEAELLIAHHLK